MADENLGGDALAGAATGGALGTVVPGIGNVVGAIGGGLLGLLGGIFSNNANKDAAASTNAFNAQQVQEQERYQTEMSNTAYQRSMADMQKAGLNPMLAYMKGGASTPSGSAASGVTPTLSSPLNAGLSSAMDTLRLKKSMESTDADIENKAAATALLEVQGEKETSNAKSAELNAKLLEAQLPAAMAQAGWDKKSVDFDNILKRTNGGVGLIGNALGAAGKGLGGGVGSFIKSLFSSDGSGGKMSEKGMSDYLKNGAKYGFGKK